MRVFAVTAEGLQIFPSVRAFEAAESWIDEKWVRICTTRDLSMYEERDPSGGHVVYTAEELRAHEIMHEQYLAHGDRRAEAWPPAGAVLVEEARDECECEILGSECHSCEADE